MTTGVDAVGREWSEATFQAKVEGLLRHYGWLHYHAPDNKPRTGRGGRQARQRVTPGFPDLVAVKHNWLIVAELKTGKGKLTDPQKRWLEALSGVGLAVNSLVQMVGPFVEQGLIEDRTADRPLSIEVCVWRPADFDAIHDRLALGEVKQQPIT